MGTSEVVSFNLVRIWWSDLSFCYFYSFFYYCQQILYPSIYWKIPSWQHLLPAPLCFFLFSSTTIFLTFFTFGFPALHFYFNFQNISNTILVIWVTSYIYINVKIIFKLKLPYNYFKIWKIFQFLYVFIIVKTCCESPYVFENATPKMTRAPLRSVNSRFCISSHVAKSSAAKFSRSKPSLTKAQRRKQKPFSQMFGIFQAFLRFQLQNPFHWLNQWTSIPDRPHPLPCGSNQQQSYTDELALVGQNLTKVGPKPFFSTLLFEQGIIVRKSRYLEPSGWCTTCGSL